MRQDIPASVFSEQSAQYKPACQHDTVNSQKHHRRGNGAATGVLLQIPEPSDIILGFDPNAVRRLTSTQLMHGQGIGQVKDPVTLIFKPPAEIDVIEEQRKTFVE
jgi:hypothetical protein